MAKPKPKNQLNSYARFSGITFQMIAIIGLGTYGGIKLNEKYPNKFHAFTLIGSLGSIAITLFIVVRRVTNFSKKNSLDE